MSVITFFANGEDVMAGHRTHVIDDSASLQAWRRQLRTNIGPNSLPTILVQFPEFADEQNQSLSALANRYRTACGCASGGLFMSVAVVWLVASHFISGNSFSDITFANVLSFVGISVAATLFGKFLGLIWARCRMLRLATRMHNLNFSGARRALTIESI